MPNSAPDLAIANIDVRFDALKALDDVSLSVDSGEIVALIGPNGAGKTTLLNVVCGLQPSDRGFVRLKGADIAAQRTHMRARLGLGRTFQHARLLDNLTVMENVLVGSYAANHGTGFISEWLRLPAANAVVRGERERAAQLLAELQLLDFADVVVANLSFGHKKLVDLARALMARPRVLLLDEPTAGLSVAEIDKLADVIDRIRGTAAIVLVAHHMGFVARVANRVMCLVAGRTVAHGTPQEVRSDPQVLAAYMGT